MNRKSVKKNYIYSIAYEMVALFIPLLTTPYISRVLGAEGIGTYSYSYSIVAYFVYFASLGTTVYARREIAYRQEDIKKRSVFFWEVFILRLVTTGISAFLYAIYVYYTASTVMLIQGLYIVAVLFDITWLFQGMENFGKVILRNIVIKILGIIFIFLFVKSKDDLELYLLGMAGFPVLANLFLWCELKDYVIVPWKLKAKYMPFQHVRGAWEFFVPTIAAQVYLLLDKTLIGSFTIGSEENGYYEQSQKVIKICYSFVTTFATVMSPRIANLFVSGAREEIIKQMKKSFQVLWFLSTPIVFGLFAIVENLVPWFFGEEFVPVKTLLYIFGWIIFPIGLNSITGNQFLIAIKQQKWYTRSIIFGATINLIINLILIPKFFSVGAAIASVIAEAIVTLVQLVYIVKVMKFFSFRDVFYKAPKYFISGIIMGMIVFVTAERLVANFYNTCVLIILGAICYIMLLLVFRDDLVKEFIGKLYKKMNVKCRRKNG